MSNNILSMATGAYFVFHPNVPVGVWLVMQILTFLLTLPLILNAFCSGREVFDLAVGRKPYYMEWLNHLCMIYHAYSFACLALWWLPSNWTWMMLGLYVHAAVVAFIVIWIIKKEGREKLTINRVISYRFFGMAKDLFHWLLLPAQ